MAEVKQREIWVDNVKVIACILVVLGHFFQSMTKADILPANDIFYWFNQTIYYFHVPLFFICSGFLYQNFSKVCDIHSWGRNIGKKILNLGVPYFTFSFTTWILKTVFSSSTNDQIGGLTDTLFFHPTSPYWYLYALFFIFLITPTFKARVTAGIGLVAATGLKLFGILVRDGIQAVSYVLSNEIWFVIGMSLSVWNVKKYIKKDKIVASVALGVLFVSLSVWLYKANVQHEIVNFLMGVISCSAIIMLLMTIFDTRRQNIVFGYLSKYTMPIFLMHTLFSAPLRALLFKAGIQNAMVHVILGLIISFTGPIVAAVIMKKSKWLEFFLYPGVFVKTK